jgi:hypothetical protein
MRERPRGKVVIYIMGYKPAKYDPEDIYIKLTEYISQNEDPLVQEFCVNYGISTTRFYEIASTHDGIKDSIKKAMDKQEAYIVRNAAAKKISEAFSIFRLKQPQHGWTDKQELQVDAKVVTFEGNDKLPK